ncbi:MAG: CbrC family protein [Pyrinomonadaceae bacterium]|nr:CbrC family protein [Phycisphaerales bacterium]
MSLPVFNYHPDPIQSGSVAVATTKCVCCGKARGYVYAGPIYAEDELDDLICPWCIADGTAHEKFDATFADAEAFADDLPGAVVEEITTRTPGFNVWQGERWLACCGGVAAFIEPVGITELRQRYRSLEMQVLSNIIYDLHISGGAAHRMLESLNRDLGPTAYVFKCLRCESMHTFVDGIFSVTA